MCRVENTAQSKPVLIVTCRGSSTSPCEHEVGNVLFIKDPCVKVKETPFIGVLIVYSNLDVNTAYRAVAFREYGFVESIIPIHCSTRLPLDRSSLEECLRRVTNVTTPVKVKVKSRGVRGISSSVYKLVIDVLKSLGVRVESNSSSCLFIEIISEVVYIGVGACKPVFKASIMNS
jgi:tRNA acetyltransferase TAN1